MGWLGIDPKSIDKILMKPEYYSVLNGEKAIDHLLSVVGE